MAHRNDWRAGLIGRQAANIHVGAVWTTSLEHCGLLLGRCPGTGSLVCSVDCAALAQIYWGNHCTYGCRYMRNCSIHTCH